MKRLGVARELLSFVASNRKWWLLPILFVFLLLGSLMVLAGGSALAPFIYTIF